jgi:DNA-binding HxlR family transcriptional regulator
VRSYGQYCALARTLDVVGDRWTLLVVRELLLGDRSYGELLHALVGVPTNLLAARLRGLEQDGLVVRDVDPTDRRRVRYALTARGHELEPAVLALVRWGGPLMVDGRGEDHVEPHWLLLALRALLRGPTDAEGAVDISCDGVPVGTVVAGDGQRDVVPPAAGAGATVDGGAEVLLGVASGHLTARAGESAGLAVSGRAPLARRLLTPAR